MTEGEEGVNIEHLLVEAMHNTRIPLPEDPLPSAEEIAGARAAVAAAHSTCSAAAVPAQPVKGLGGAGLGLKRKGGKAGNASTISAATAPPALVAGPGAKGLAGSTRAAGSGSNLGTGSAAAHKVGQAGPTAAGAAGGADVAAKTAQGAGGGAAAASGGAKALSKDAAGVRSFRTIVSPDTADEGSSSEWESVSDVEGEVSSAAAAHKSSANSSTGWSSSLSNLLDDFVDPGTLAVCGVVLGVTAGAVLVLGAGLWLRSRQ